MPMWKRFAAARAADALEFEQALIRIYVVACCFAYFLAYMLWDGFLDDREHVVLVAGAGEFLVCMALLGWILLRPGVNHLRRRTGMVADMTACTMFMLLNEESGTLLFTVYLWVAIGNGFRFGRWSLHYAQALAIAGFTIVAIFNPYWQQHASLTVALFVGLVAIPWYVSLLISRLNAATQRLHEARGEAEAANTAKTKFLAAASHDLRQPMQALSMYTSVLEDRVTDPNSLRVVHGIQLSVRTLEQLFDSLLDISKIESGVIRPRVVEFPLMPLIDNVIEAERPIAEQRKLDLRGVRTSVSVRSDPALLERMLKNLVTNAIRYTERGRIVVGCRRRGGDRLALEVVDSGIGIPAEEQDRIFEDYYQIAGNVAQGLGLGLPIVKSLGELLGHRVAVRSAPGHGSVFSIELERAGNLVVPVAGTSTDARGGIPSRDTLRGIGVVLVDDDVEIRHSMQLLLEGWGCRVASGGTLAEVQDKLRRQRMAPDALIIDYQLTAITGLQVIDQLRAAHGRQLPALIITGTANLTLLQQRAPGIPVAIKPVPPGKLRAFLSQARRHQSDAA